MFYIFILAYFCGNYSFYFAILKVNYIRACLVAKVINVNEVNNVKPNFVNLKIVN